MKLSQIFFLVLLALSTNFSFASDKEFVCNASYTLSREDSNGRPFLEIKSYEGNYDSRNLHEVFATDLDFFNDNSKIATINLKSPESKSEFTLLIKKALDRTNNFGVFSVNVSQSNLANSKKDSLKELSNTLVMFEITKLNALNGVYIESRKSGIKDVFIKCFIRQK